MFFVAEFSGEKLSTLFVASEPRLFETPEKKLLMIILDIQTNPQLSPVTRSVTSSI